MERTSSTNGNACSTCGPRWRLPLLLALVLAAIFLMRGRGIRQEGQESNEAAPNPTSTAVGNEIVTLAIDSGESKPFRKLEIPWREGMTVGDLMAGASQLPGGIRFEIQGTEEMTLLTQIGDLANEGAGGRNWIYSVNGERADRSYAIYPLQAGDRVLWEFTGQQ